MLREQARPPRSYEVVATTGIFKIQPFFGTTVQFPLKTTLAARKGDLIALTVPTWAPVLAVNLPQENGWRASRASDCSDLLHADRADRRSATPRSTSASTRRRA